MKRSILAIFVLIGFNAAGQSLTDYYKRLNFTETIDQLYKYYNADTLILLYSGEVVDTLCYCRVIDDRTLNCLMDLVDTTDDIIITADHTYLNLNVRRSLRKHIQYNKFIGRGSYVLSELDPTAFNVVEVKSYNRLASGDIFNMYNYLPQYEEVVFKCWTDTTDVQNWLEKGYYDYTIFKIDVNKPVTDKDQIVDLLIDPLESISIETKEDYHYPNLKRIIVPINGDGIQGSVVNLINLLGKSNPQAVVYLSFQIVDSIGRWSANPNTDAFHAVTKIKTSVHVDVEPFYPSHLDSVVALIPGKRIKSLRLIFPGSPANKSIDLGQFQSIQYLENLEEIYFEGKTGNLPPGIENLPNLKLLSGAFESIPHSLGHIQSLEALHLNCEYLDSLNSFENRLTNLKLLQLDYIDNIKEVPSSFKKCEKLQVLELSYWDSLSSFSAFHNLPIELMIFGAGMKPWSFILNETQSMPSLKVLAYGSGEYFDPKSPPFAHIKALYIEEQYQQRYMNSPFIDKLRSQNKLILLDSRDDLSIDSVSDSVEELIKILRWFPTYALKK